MSDVAKRIVETETWYANGDYVSRERGGTGWMFDSDVQASIAACAPEALRMLMEHPLGHDATCLWCRGLCSDVPHTDDDHLDDCGWLALMKKAGLR